MLDQISCTISTITLSLMRQETQGAGHAVQIMGPGAFWGMKIMLPVARCHPYLSELAMGHSRKMLMN